MTWRAGTNQHAGPPSTAANIRSANRLRRLLGSATEPPRRQRPVTLVPGVNETPRRTSPKPADRTVPNISVVGNVVVAMVSVMTTSLLGSAPWSPLPLTVEVMAQIVAVPSPLLRPMMLRSPSVAGDQGRPVAELVPVG